MKVFLIAILFAATSYAAVQNPNAVAGGTYYANLGREPSTLNPITSSDLYATQVQAYVMESLMARNPDTYKWEPLLAEKVEISKDGKTFTYTLRENLKWQDGKPLTIEDVKFSFDVIFNPEYNANHLVPYYENIASAKVIDKKTIQFVAKTKYFNNINVLNGLEVFPKHIYGDAKKGKKKNKTLMGSGPYVLENWQKGRRIVLKRNKNWWGNGLAQFKGQYNFDKVILRFAADDNVAIEMLKKGDVDYLSIGDPEVYVKKADGPLWGKKVFKKKVTNKAPKGYNFIAWNFRKDIFKDKKVRYALSHLINRELMNKKFRYDMSLMATGPWYPQSDYADSSVKPVLFDSAKALKLLREAGWKDSDKNGVLDKVIDGKKQEFRFTLINANKDNMRYYTLFKEDAKKVGVDVELKLVEWNTLVKLLDEGNFDAVTLGWGGGSVDHDPKQIWHSSSARKGGSNFIAYKNPEVDKLIDEARQILDRDERIKKYKKIYRLIAADMPYSFMFTNKFQMYAHTARMQMPSDTFKYGVDTGFWWIKE